MNLVKFRLFSHGFIVILIWIVVFFGIKVVVGMWVCDYPCDCDPQWFCRNYKM